MTEFMGTPGEEYTISAEANLFPEASPEEYQDIFASIEEIGQQEAIGVKDGQIIDGRNRYRACRELGVEPRFTELDADVDPLKYVLAKNLARRHLDASQRAVIAYKLSAWSKPGGDRRSEAYREGVDQSAILPDGFTQEQSAKLLAVSPRSVRQAGKVISEDSPAAPALRQAVEQGEVKVGDAAKVVGQSVEVQERALAAVQGGKARTIAGSVKAILVEQLAPNPMSQSVIPNRTIIIDPPWPTDKRAREDRANGQGVDHETMTVDQITRMQLPLADDGFVFLWTIQEYLPDAIRMLERWKVKYLFTMVWRKDDGMEPRGTSHFDVEFVLVGAKGKPQFLNNFSRFKGDEAELKMGFNGPCESPRAAHSVKPAAFYDIVKQFTPGPRLELPESGLKHL